MRLKHLLPAAVAWALAAGTAAADFNGPVFAAPLPPGPGRPVVPAGGPLVAPVITPVGTRHGKNVFDVIPAGCGDVDPFLTKHPERHIAEAFECGPCRPRETAWASAEFLYWATQGPWVPALVTTGPPVVPFGAPAALGSPFTTVLFGNERLLNEMRPGLRVEAGLWLDAAQRYAASARFFTLGSVSERLVGGSDGTNLVNVPQVVPVFGVPVQVPVYVGFPGLTRGTVSATAQTNFLGGDLSLRRGLRVTPDWRVDLLGGYRYLHLGDHVGASFDAAGTGPLGLRLMGEDSVRTRNNFHGSVVGLGASGRLGRFTVEALSTVALGVTASDIDRSRTRSVGLGALPGLVGLPVLPGLGLPTMIPVVQTGGRVSADYFAVVPEVGVKFGWHPTEHLRMTVGYNFLYWSTVRRAQELYDLSPTTRTGVTDFWAQGVGLGLELRY